ncbi:MAG: helicase-associated domain-containing protein [Acidimicrobiales bacterium]
MARTKTTAPAPTDRLAAALADFDDEALRHLLEARPDLVAPAPADLAALARRAGAWPSLAAAYRGLDRWCQQVVQALCLLPPGRTVAGVAAFIGLGPDGVADVGEAVGRLAALGLVVADHPGPGMGPDTIVHLVPGFAELSWPANLGPPLRYALGATTAGELTAMARRLGVPAGKGKAQAVEALEVALCTPEVVQDAVAAGPPGTASLASRVAHGGPVTTIPGGLYSGTSDRTPVGWLVNRGILVADSWTTAVMPGEVGLALRGGRPFPEPANRRPPLAPVAVGAERADGAAAEAALRLVADLVTVLDDWSVTPAKLLKAGGVGVRDVRRAAKALGRTEPETARLVDVAAAAGLVVADLATLTALPTEGYDGWLLLDPAERWGRLVEAWLASPRHLGLAGETNTREKPIPALLPRPAEPEAGRRRRSVLSVLASVEPGSAVPAAGLGPRMAWEAPMLWAGGPGTPEMMVEWVVAEAELLGLAAHRALSTAGRLAVGGRLPEAVSALAGRAPAVSSTFVVQADLTVVAPGTLAAAVRSELDLVADVESTGAATVYRLSEASLRRGFDAGRTADDITSFLADHASRAVPQSLTYLVADLGRRFGRVRLGSARCYVRSDDPSLLAEVARHRRTARLGLRLLAPTVAVTGSAPDEVLDAIRGAGYLPAAEDAGGGLVVSRPERRRAAPPSPSHSAAWPGSHAEALAELRRRAGTAPPPPAGEELDALVARLRRARPPGPPPPAPGTGRPGAASPSPAAVRPAAVPPPPRPAPSLPDPFPDLDLFDVPARPMEIVKRREAVADLLGRAFVEDWALRLAYTNRKGSSTQLNVVVLSPPEADVLVEVLPAGTERTLNLDRVEWARVLTDAEEELLY